MSCSKTTGRADRQSESAQSFRPPASIRLCRTSTPSLRDRVISVLRRCSSLLTATGWARSARSTCVHAAFPPRNATRSRHSAGWSCGSWIDGAAQRASGVEIASSRRQACHGVSTNARGTPLYRPPPTIWPRSLMPLAMVNTQPESGGRSVFRSTIVESHITARMVMLESFE